MSDTEEKKEILKEVVKNARVENGFHKFLGKVGAFFAVNNDVNENTVMGVIAFGFLMWAVFNPDVSNEKFYTLAGTVALFFGLNLKK